MKKLKATIRPIRPTCQAVWRQVLLVRKQNEICMKLSKCIYVGCKRTLFERVN